MGNNSSSYHQASTMPQKSRDELDASSVPDPIEHHSVTTSTRHKYLLSLDRSMKVFLRASNLPGLEYRLRLAGYHTFHDLLSANRQTLEDKGFTGIMAQRLLRAISNYLRRQLSRRQEERLPFQLVRRGQKIKTEPSESLRENPNYRKRNVKRQKSLGEESARRGTSGGGLLQSVQVPRLLSESDLQLQHLLSPPPSTNTTITSPEDQIPRDENTVVTVDNEGTPVETEEGNTIVNTRHECSVEASVASEANNRKQKILGVIVKEDDALLVVEENLSASNDNLPFSDLDDDVLREEALFSLKQIHPSSTDSTPSDAVEETDHHIQRSYSIPADLKLTAMKTAYCRYSEDFVFYRIRAFSCSTISSPQGAKLSDGQCTI